MRALFSLHLLTGKFTQTIANFNIMTTEIYLESKGAQRKRIFENLDFTNLSAKRKLHRIIGKFKKRGKTTVLTAEQEGNSVFVLTIGRFEGISNRNFFSFHPVLLIHSFLASTGSDHLSSLR